ncbi:hypothetical protein [Nocardia cyriacigeorgica]|uniref:hypothetical protein n=1 Tax=Nocardia cyriacigeorgica TaxID=135487 RepID=UPI0024560666|nr:hypothetical protein [Nocardia cyriacigeorgica]
MADYAHSDAAARSRAEKARRLAGFLWDRGITGTELLAMPAALRRKLARAAQTNPPSTGETWESVARLLDEKDVWAARHPDHPAAGGGPHDAKIIWGKPPETPRW